MRAAALIGAAAFLLLGVLGLAGVLGASIVLDLVHLALGAAGLVLARTRAGARGYVVGGGVASLVLWFLGAAALGGRLHLGYTESWVHFALGVGLVALGFATARAVNPSCA